VIHQICHNKSTEGESSSREHIIITGI